MYYPQAIITAISEYGVTLLIPDSKVLNDSIEGIEFLVPDNYVIDYGENPYSWIALLFNNLLNEAIWVEACPGNDNWTVLNDFYSTIMNCEDNIL